MNFLKLYPALVYGYTGRFCLQKQNKTKDTSKAKLKNILRRTFKQLSWFYLRGAMLVHIHKLTVWQTFPHSHTPALGDSNLKLLKLQINWTHICKHKLTHMGKAPFHTIHSKACHAEHAHNLVCVPWSLSWRKIQCSSYSILVGCCMQWIYSWKSVPYGSAVLSARLCDNSAPRACHSSGPIFTWCNLQYIYLVSIPRSIPQAFQKCINAGVTQMLSWKHV